MKKFLKMLLPFAIEVASEQLNLDSFVIKKVIRNPDGTVARKFLKQTKPTGWIWVNNPAIANKYDAMEALLFTLSLRENSIDEAVSFRFSKEETEIKYYKKKNA